MGTNPIASKLAIKTDCCQPVGNTLVAQYMLYNQDASKPERTVQWGGGFIFFLSQALTGRHSVCFRFQLQYQT